MVPKIRTAAVKVNEGADSGLQAAQDVEAAQNPHEILEVPGSAASTTNNASLAPEIDVPGMKDHAVFGHGRFFLKLPQKFLAGDQ